MSSHVSATSIREHLVSPQRAISIVSTGTKGDPGLESDEDVTARGFGCYRTSALFSYRNVTAVIL